MENMKRYITKRKKRFIVISIFLLILFINAIARPTQIIPISGGQEYDITGTFDEYYVVINPPIAPWKATYLKKLISNYDKMHPVAAPAPPEDTRYVFGYSRYFFSESDAFPRDIEFTADFRPSDILTEEYNLRDRIAYIHADYKEISYAIFLRFGNGDGYFWDISRSYEEENADPTLNGLYNNVPDYMIPRYSRGYENAIGG